MRIDKFLAVASILISSIALILSFKAIQFDALGTDISKYDLSSPENTLKSISKMVSGQDVRAGWQFMKIALQTDSSPELKLFFSENPNISVLKSIEVSNSANPKNNGIIVSFVKFNVAGVDYNVVMCFRKDMLNRFYFAEKPYISYGTKENDHDKDIQSAIEVFEKTGKL